MQLSDLTNKTPEELNVMCAELCGDPSIEKRFRYSYKIGCNKFLSSGWHDKDSIEADRERMRHAADSVGDVEEYPEGKATPNYTGSWDAIMPEVRKLTEDQFINYLVHLTDVSDGEQVGQFRAHYDSRLVTIALILTLHP